MCVPRSVGQIPIYYNYKNTGRPSIPAPDLVFWAHYSDEKNTPLYPFGHGLSYTNFSYSDLKIENNYDAKKEVKVSVTLTNSGGLLGKEVAQLYLRDRHASITRPVRELKGFELVELAPGASKTLQFTLTDKELGFFDNNGVWLVEPGAFDIYIGGSSTATLKDKFDL
jgi:beta-glucosidase